MANLNVVNSATSLVYLTFLMARVATGEIRLGFIELNSISPLTNLPTGALNSRKKEVNNIYDAYGNKVGETSGQEITNDEAITVEFIEDFNQVLKQDIQIVQEASRDRLVSILIGGIFKIQGEDWRVLGVGGNINYNARMTGKMLENDWKWLLDREVAYIKDGVAFSEDGVAVIERNSYLGRVNTESLGLVLEIYFYTGTNEVRNMRYPLSIFTNVRTNIDAESNKVTADMSIKADGLETQDFFVNGGATKNAYFYEVENIEFFTGTLTVPSTLEANKQYLFIEETTGEVRLVDNKIDVTETTPFRDGTRFYCRKYKLDVTASTNPCDTNTDVEYTPVYVATHNFECINNAGTANYTAKAVQWLVNPETTVTNKESFLLFINEYQSDLSDFSIYDSSNQ